MVKKVCKPAKANRNRYRGNTYVEISSPYEQSRYTVSSDHKYKNQAERAAKQQAYDENCDRGTNYNFDTWVSKIRYRGKRK